MSEQMVITELLERSCDDQCKEMLKEKLKQKIGFLLPAFMGISPLISLCIVVSVLHERQNPYSLRCSLHPIFKKDDVKTCLYIDKYPLSNEVFARICVNETVQIDMRRFYKEKPTDEGITLNQMQWQYLKRSIDHVDKSILQSHFQKTI